MQKFKTPESNKNTIIISLGDPSGIGTEIILKALGSKYLNNNIKPLIVGCKNNIYETYAKLINHGIDNIPEPDKLDIIDIPLEKKIKLTSQHAKISNTRIKQKHSYYFIRRSCRDRY